MYSWVSAAIAWIPSALAIVYLWRRKDIGLLLFGLWTVVLLVPWVGVLTYVAWNSAPRVTAAVLLGVGMLGVHDIITPGIKCARALDWDRVRVESYDDGWQYGFHGSDTLDPRYAYFYRGKRFDGRQLSFMPPPWYESAYRVTRTKEVFVNPRNPAESVVHRNLPWRVVRRGAFAVASAVAGVVLLWAEKRRRQMTSA